MLISNTIDMLALHKYINNTLIFDSNNPQTSSVTLPISGLYEVTAVGAGGGADGGCSKKDKNGDLHAYTGHGGGSGAAIKCVMYLQAGKYTIQIGSGGRGAPLGGPGGWSAGNGSATLFKYGEETIINAAGGTGGGNARPAACARKWHYPGSTGSGGSLSVSGLVIIKTVYLQSNGLPGNGTSGGNSVLSGTSYGKGGNANSGSGNNGYFKIVLL